MPHLIILIQTVGYLTAAMFAEFWRRVERCCYFHSQNLLRPALAGCLRFVAVHDGTVGHIVRVAYHLAPSRRCITNPQIGPLGFSFILFDLTALPLLREKPAYPYTLLSVLSHRL